MSLPPGADGCGSGGSGRRGGGQRKCDGPREFGAGTGVVLSAGRRLLLVHAHPDDETITTGATIAKYLAEGTEVTVVTCTLGEEGEVTEPTLEGLRAHASDQLGGYRVWELREALRHLGGPAHEFLGGVGRYRDSGMAGDPANVRASAFSVATSTPAGRAQAAAELAAVIERARPQVVITYPPDGGYGHPDHMTARAVTMAALERVGRTDAAVSAVYETVVPRRRASAGHAASVRAAPRLAEIGMRPAASVDDWAYVVPDDDVDVRIDAGRYLDAKTKALAAHASQERVVPPFYALTNGIALPLDGVEHYRRVRDLPPDLLARGDCPSADRPDRPLADRSSHPRDRDDEPIGSDLFEGIAV